MYQFYGWETASPFVRKLYDDLLQAWCAETCAPRMRGDWSPENRTFFPSASTSRKYFIRRNSFVFPYT